MKFMCHSSINICMFHIAPFDGGGWLIYIYISYYYIIRYIYIYIYTNGADVFAR